MKQKHYILLVEDDPFLRSLLSAELAEHGYLVLKVENGTQALELIKTHHVCAVLTDIFMPDMDGIELIQHLRRHHADMPVFALSGGTSFAKAEEYLKFAKHFGANEVFVKPIDVAMLINTLEQYCQHSGGE